MLRCNSQQTGDPAAVRLIFLSPVFASAACRVGFELRLPARHSSISTTFPQSPVSFRFFCQDLATGHEEVGEVTRAEGIANGSAGRILEAAVRLRARNPGVYRVDRARVARLRRPISGSRAHALEGVLPL